MILFFEYGRLGNQLFQYVGLKKHFPNDSLIFFGCEELHQCFDNVDARFICKNTISRRIPFGLLKKIIFFLANVRILGRIIEDSNSNRFNLIVRKGLLPGIFVPQNVFFQHHDVVEYIEDNPVLKPELLKLAKHWLKSKDMSLSKEQLVFVHIRRGDYLTWPSPEFPAVLNLEWYCRAMDKITKQVKNPVFLILSDDPYYVQDVFSDNPKVIISNNSQNVDLALMSLCSNGILSASSFAWWGAFYARSGSADNVTFIAPKYWGGHRSKKWYPKNFISEWITYKE